MVTKARTLDAVLSALGDTLALESELGTRAVELDRALLLPVSYAKEQVKPSPEPEPVKPAPLKAAEPAAPLQTHLQAPAPKKDNPPQIPLYAFLSFKELSPAGSQLLDKMIAAMKLPEGGWAVECIGRKGASLPPAMVYILLGRDTQKALLPRSPANPGVWVNVAGVPAISTYSPDFILNNFGGDPAAMRKAKLSVWDHLKSALARLGRSPRKEG